LSSGLYQAPEPPNLEFGKVLFGERHCVFTLGLILLQSALLLSSSQLAGLNSPRGENKMLTLLAFVEATKTAQICQRLLIFNFEQRPDFKSLFAQLSTKTSVTRTIPYPSRIVDLSQVHPRQQALLPPAGTLQRFPAVRKPQDDAEGDVDQQVGLQEPGGQVELPARPEAGVQVLSLFCDLFSYVTVGQEVVAAAAKGIKGLEFLRQLVIGLRFTNIKNP